MGTAVHDELTVQFSRPFRWTVAEAESVLAAIINRSLCMPCIVDRSRVSQARVESVFAAVGTTLGIVRRRGTCEPCGEPSEVFRLG